MKLARIISRTSTFLSQSQSPHLNNIYISGSTTKLYSTKILNPKREQQTTTLYRRISPMGNSNESIVPVLDKWIEEGRPVSQNELRTIIRELRRYGRFKHALQISEWMSDKRYMHPFVCDVAVRLDLIAKVNGIEQAENYFNNTPKLMRTCEVYGALLYCYAHVKYVDKAEGVIQKMREFGFPMQTVNYNAMLKLYCQTRNNEKVDALIHEMEKNQIKFDKYTYSFLLNSYVPEFDNDGIEKILMRIDTDADLNIDWAMYADVANRFLGAGSVDKALKLLRKSEKLVAFAKNKNDAFANLLTLYATAGKKEEVLRMWNECKKLKVRNRDYMCMLSSILKFDDIETAEKIYDEWEAGDLSKDIRVPNFLISFYCKNDLVQKAEALMESLKLKNWEKPNASTWCWMSFAYVQSNQMLKAVKAMESGLLLHYPGSRWKLDKESTVMCIKYLKEEGDVNRSSNVVRLLKDNGIISEASHHRLLAYFSGEHALEDGLLENDSA